MPSEYYSEYTPYWQGRTQQEEASRSALATAIMEEELRKREQDRQVQSMALDLLRGYGTPGERAEELYRPTPGLAAALKGGGVASNITPEGGYTITGPEGIEPIPGMRDIRSAPLEPIQRALVKKSLLGTAGELPEETLQREMMLEGERFKKAGMLAEETAKRTEKQSISAEKRAQGYQETALEREDIRARRSLAVTFAGNRLNEVARREQVAEAAKAKVQAQYMNTAVTGGLQLPGAQERWAKTLAGAEETYNRQMSQYQKERDVVQAQLDSIQEELGIAIPKAKVQTQPSESENFDKYMQKKLESTSYAYFTTSGLTADVIVNRAKQKGVTPEEYLDAMIEVKNVQGKKRK